MSGVIAIIQARVGSNRLPGKVLKPLNGTPSICHVMERTAATPLIDKVILATSTQPENDPLETLANERSWDIYRGSENDVISRFTDITDRENPDVVVRVCADNFAIDPQVVNLAIAKRMADSLDICNPFLDYQYPFGVGAEVMAAETLRRMERASREEASDYREHITLWAYEHPNEFSFDGLDAPTACARPDISVSVDTPEDFDRINAIFGEFRGRETEFTTVDIIETWDRLQLNAPRQEPRTSR
jgi:spore coat polysaccharide biosynthesis protein SpsF